MKRKANKKNQRLLIVLAVCLVIVVGAVLAARNAKNKQLDNAYNEQKVSCAVVEDASQPLQNSVRIQNTGTVLAYMRVEVVATWKSADGKTWPMKPIEGIDYSISMVEKKGWVQGADGYYYYTDAVAPIDDPKTPMSDETLTNVLISNVKQIKQSPKGVDGTQYSLAIEIIAHAIQAAPDEVVGQEWSNEKVQVSGKNGILTVEKKENP